MEKEFIITGFVISCALHGIVMGWSSTWYGSGRSLPAENVIYEVSLGGDNSSASALDLAELHKSKSSALQSSAEANQKPNQKHRISDRLSVKPTGKILSSLPTTLSVDATRRKELILSNTPTTVNGEEGEATTQVSGNTSNGYGTGIGPISIYSPKPRYPAAARRDGFEGVVLLSVNLDQYGVPTEVLVTESSGRTDCDQAALATVQNRWRFKPAKIGEVPVQAQLHVAIEFSLTE